MKVKWFGFRAGEKEVNNILIERLEKIILQSPASTGISIYRDSGFENIIAPVQNFYLCLNSELFPDIESRLTEYLLNRILQSVPLEIQFYWGDNNALSYEVDEQ